MDFSATSKPAVIATRQVVPVLEPRNRELPSFYSGHQLTVKDQIDDRKLL
jgi:phosphohistidine swiveling domain-containing protein